MGNLRWICLVIERHVLQIKDMLLQYLGFDWRMCPLQVFYMALESGM